MPEKNISIVEYAVLHALTELQSSTEVISSHDVAQLLNCDPKTVQRAVRSLLAARKIERGEGATRRGGYKYHVIKE